MILATAVAKKKLVSLHLINWHILSVVRLAKADGKTPIKVQVSLVDANDVPVSVRTAITLENDLGRWNVTDFNSQMPGVQTFMEGGLAEFELIPPEQPGDGRIRVSS